MRLFFRLVMVAAFLGGAVILPGALLGRLVTRRCDQRSVLIGVVGVLLTAAIFVGLFHARMSRYTVGAAGFAVGMVSLALLRRRER
jgi:hypothetical protein